MSKRCFSKIKSGDTVLFYISKDATHWNIKGCAESTDEYVPHMFVVLESTPNSFYTQVVVGSDVPHKYFDVNSDSKYNYKYLMWFTNYNMVHRIIKQNGLHKEN